jgi:hypothetical protein
MIMDLGDVIAVVALIISILAYQRTGGTADLKRKIESTVSPEEVKRQIDSLAAVTDSLRQKTADALDRLEKVIRKSEKGE